MMIRKVSEQATTWLAPCAMQSHESLTLTTRDEERLQRFKERSGRLSEMRRSRRDLFKKYGKFSARSLALANGSNAEIEQIYLGPQPSKTPLKLRQKDVDILACFLEEPEETKKQVEQIPTPPELDLNTCNFLGADAFWATAALGLDKEDFQVLSNLMEEGDLEPDMFPALTTTPPLTFF